MAGIRENSPAENAIFTLQISFEIKQWNLRNRLRTLHVTDGLFRALGVPRRFAACDGSAGVLANQMQACKTQIFGYLWHLLFFSNAFFHAQTKAEEYVPK